MKLCAVYVVWDDHDLLAISFQNIFHLVDGVMVVASIKSNFGEASLMPIYESTLDNDNVKIYQCEPDLNLQPVENERAKRNFGLQKARELGYTHFIMMDADEFYEPEPFLKEKQRFIDNPDLAGLVCGLKCYFRLPTLSVNDKTLLPFIHKLTADLKFTWNTNYPFAFENRKEIRIDPTRMLNINSGVLFADITMHHMSWIRKDIKKKIRNSTARQNIERSTIIRDYANAKPGYYCEFYRQTLEACENLFNIPDIIDENITNIQE